jgi:hypothetical protein
LLITGGVDKLTHAESLEKKHFFPTIDEDKGLMNIPPGFMEPILFEETSKVGTISAQIDEVARRTVSNPAGKYLHDFTKFL